MKSILSKKIGETLEYIFKFATNEKGIYDENAEINDNEATTMVPKFAKEGQSSNGVALTMNKNSDCSEYEKGIRLKPFFYSGKEIASIGKWEGKIEEEINRVKSLGAKSGWVTSSRAKGLFWEDDLITNVPGVGKVLGTALKSVELIYVKDRNRHGRNCGYHQK